MSNDNEVKEETRTELEAFAAAWEQALVANNAEAIQRRSNPAMTCQPRRHEVPRRR
jgi:hypothetical protein